MLIIDKIGKNYSGVGMDPNITGTFLTPYASGGIKAQRTVVLDLSDESHGNATGIGAADVTTDRLVEKSSIAMIAPNGITSKNLDVSKIPAHTINDQEAIEIGIKTGYGVDLEKPRVVRIANSMQVNYIRLSEVFYEFAKAHEKLEILTEPAYMEFDENFNLTDIGRAKP